MSWGATGWGGIGNTSDLKAIELIERSYKLIGRPISVNFKDALETLNALLNSWGAEGLLTHSTTQEYFSTVIGTANYTWGSGGTLTTAIPTKIVSCYIQDSDSNNHMIDVFSLKEYNDVYNKTVSGRPDNMYFDRTYPSATLKFDKTPSVVETVYLDCVKPFSDYSLNDLIALPLEYQRALRYNLAIELGIENEVEIRPDIYKIALESKKNIEKLNVHPVAPVSIESTLLSNTNFNIETG